MRPEGTKIAHLISITLQPPKHIHFRFKHMPHFQWRTVDKSPSSSSTSTSTPKPSARWGHSCCIVNDTFYLFGGFANSNYMNDLWQYSLSDLKWKELVTTGDKPERRSNGTLSYDQSNHQLLLFGGGGPSKLRFNTISTLDLKTLSWVELLPFENQSSPWERTYHVAQFISPYLIVFGGECADDLGDLWVYNINTLGWTEIKSTPTSLPPKARRFHSSCLVGTMLYLFGGCCDKYVCMNDLHALDLTPLIENASTTQLPWSQISLSGTIEPRWGHSLYHFNGELYVFGGRSNQDLNDLIAINPQNGAVRHIKVQKSPNPRRRHGGGFIGSSMVLFGGFDGNYFDDFFYINLYELIRPSLTLQIEKVHSQHSDHIISCSDHTEVQINTSMLGRYFESEGQMMRFMEAVEGCYLFEEMKTIMQTFKDGFGLLPLSGCHSSLLDYNPSSDVSSRQQAILQLINQRPSPFSKRRSQDGVIELDLHLLQRYLNVLDQHWQNDCQIIFNQTRCGINRHRLAINSEYFSHLLSKQYWEKEEVRIDVDEVQCLSFRLLMAALFTGVLVVPVFSSIHVFISLLKLAEYFSLPAIVDICEKQLCNHVSSLNYKQLLNVSTVLNLSRLAQHCSFQYLNELVKLHNEKILELPREQLHPKMRQLLQSIQFDLIHSWKNNCNYKNPVLNAENEKQNKQMNESKPMSHLK